MTAPQPAAPGAPEATTTAPAGAAAASQAQPAAPVAAPPTGSTPPAAPSDPAASADPWANPDTAKAEIERLRRENGAARTNAKAQAAEEARQQLAHDIGKALGLVKDDEPADPAKLAEQITAEKATARQAQLDLAVYQNTPTGVDASALLDSVSFRKKIAGIDPTDHLAVAAAVGEAITASPQLVARGVPKPNPAQGATGAAPTTADAARQAEAAKDWKTSSALKADQLLSLRKQTT